MSTFVMPTESSEELLPGSPAIAPIPPVELANPSPQHARVANQRAHQRVHVHFPYTLMMKNASGKEIKLSGYTEDISAGGVSIASSATIPLKGLTAVRIDLFCKGRGESIVAIVRCIHQSFAAKLGGFRYGFQFVKMNEGYRAMLERYLGSRLPA